MNLQAVIFDLDGVLSATAEDLLPGALTILQALRARDVKLAVASAGKNARFVLERLEISAYFDALADGNSVTQTMPAPDLFLFTARQLQVSPGRCAVVVGTAAGIEAALAAGMWAVGLGSPARLGRAHVCFADAQALAEADLEAAISELATAHRGWLVEENEYAPSRLGHKETIFTLGNGYLCSRGAYEERYPNETRTTFIHGVFDDMPISFTELANVPDWTNLEVFVAGERFSLAEPEGEILAYRRWLDLKTGLLKRHLTWRSPQGRTVRLESERWCSLANPHLAGLRCTVIPLNFSGAVEIRTGLMGHTDNERLRHMDIVAQGRLDEIVWLQSRTHHTQIEVSLAMQVTVQGPGPGTISQSCWSTWGQPTEVVSAVAEAGQPVTVFKRVAVTTAQEGDEALKRAVELLQTNADPNLIVARSKAEWARNWAASDVIIAGDPEAQLAIRFSIFQLFIAASTRNDRVSIGAKTLSGYGYRGHVFWDTEIFILPLFIFTRPQIARNLLIYRYHNLPGARANAAAHGFEGAQFPWESAGEGTEVTPRWVPDFQKPTQLVRIWPGDIEIHITADIAYAAWFYWQTTGDDAWMRDYGAELILEGAVFWGSRVEKGAAGLYHLRDVIGPDEYHDHVDDNAFTNKMVAWHLQTALDILAWLSQQAAARRAELVERLNLTAERLQHWADVSRRMYIGEDARGLIEQFAGFFDLADVDLAILRNPERTKSMQVILGIEGANQTQVLKQPDVLMLQYLLRDRYSLAQIRTNWDYYHPRTDHEHGSSLGPAITAILACLMDSPEEGYLHFMRAARADLHDIRLNTSHGIHAASAGGLWQAVVFGFAGLALEPESYHFSPHLPGHWTRLAFALELRGKKLWVEIRPDQPVEVKERVEE